MHVTFDLYRLKERRLTQAQVQVVGTFSFCPTLKEVVWVSPVAQSTSWYTDQCYEYYLANHF